MPSFKLSTPGSTLSGAMSFQDRIAVRYLRSVRMWDRFSRASRFSCTLRSSRRLSRVERSPDPIGRRIRACGASSQARPEPSSESSAVAEQLIAPASAGLLRPVSGCPFHKRGTDIHEIINLTSSQPIPPVPIIAMAMQDGMDNYRISFQGEENPIREPLGQYTPDFVAAADNRKRERIFQGACDRLIDRS